MKMRFKAMAWLGMAMLASSALAQTGEGFTGRYHGGSVDTSHDLIVLPDQTFCFSLIAGNLDLMVGGRWQTMADADSRRSIRLTEVRQPGLSFLVMPQQIDDPAKVPAGQRVVMFGGANFSRAEGVFLGFSLDDLRPVFGLDHHVFASRYSIAIPKGAKRLYVGLPPSGRSAQQGSASVLEYAIDDTRMNTIRVGYDHDAARPLYDWVGTRNGNTFQLRGKQGGAELVLRSETISTGLRESVQQKCINPALGKGVDSKGDTQLSKPLRTVAVPMPLPERASWIAAEKE